MSCGIGVKQVETLQGLELVKFHEKVTWVVMLGKSNDVIARRQEIKDYLDEVSNLKEARNVIILDEKQTEDGFWVHYVCSWRPPRFLASAWSNETGFLVQSIMDYKQLCLGDVNVLEGKTLSTTYFANAPFIFTNTRTGIHFDIFG